ncbi:MAG TPA: WG repeat-containing protein [Kamptonema sp.]|nr:WG repeat-containing protein [Kamptonema sp.]
MPSTFSDINNHWAKSCILELAKRNLISGYPDGRFRPDATITRAEFAALVRWTFPNSKRSPNSITFSDVTNNHWAQEAIEFAYQTGFMSGYPNSLFKLKQAIPRVEALVALTNGLKFSTPEKPKEMLLKYFDDAGQIPSYAVGAIAAATQNRLVVNYPNIKQFKPNQNATRAEVIAFICQALKISAVPLQYIADLFEIPLQFNSASSFVNGVAQVQVGSDIRYINTKGKFVTAPPSNETPPEPFPEGLQPKFSEGKWGYIDRSDNWVIQPQFNRANNFKDGLASIMIGNKWGWIEKTGKVVIEPQFELVEEFSEGLARVLKEKVGYIDKTGKMVIPPQFGGIGIFPGDAAHVMSFKEGGKFSEGLAAVEIVNERVNQKWGYIDKTGKIVVEPQFEGAGNFADGLAPVNIGGQWGINSIPAYLEGGKWGYIRHPLK